MVAHACTFNSREVEAGDHYALVVDLDYTVRHCVKIKY